MLELDGGTLWVTATHLTTGSPEERAAQVAALAALHTEPMEAGVLVGDFNARPDAPELARAARALHRRLGAGPRRATTRPAGGSGSATRATPTRRASPHRRIDQVWVSAGVTVAAAQVLDAGGASDHLPLVVDLEVVRRLSGPRSARLAGSGRCRRGRLRRSRARAAAG